MLIRSKRSDFRRGILRTALVLIVVFISGLILGTMVGFNISINELSKCREVSCGELGIQNSTSVARCEVCFEGGVRVLGISGTGG